MREEILHNFFIMGILFAFLGILFSWIAQKYHFFRLKDLPRPPLHMNYPIGGILGYLLVFFLVVPLGMRFLGGVLKELLEHSPIFLMTLMQILALASTVTYLFLFSLMQPKETLQRIWIHPKRFRIKCLFEDFGMGILTWIIAFPVVVFTSQCVEFFTYLLTGVTGIEQVAIRYLKMASESPFLLSVALFAILIAAPMIEEYVFRGLLLSYLKQKLGFKNGLLLSALIFSLFHFSPSQGVSNFALIASLFVLSLYLGFLYERQASLIAPIALHMTFNSISVMRILLFSS